MVQYHNNQIRMKQNNMCFIWEKTIETSKFQWQPNTTADLAHPSKSMFVFLCCEHILRYWVVTTCDFYCTTGHQHCKIAHCKFLYADQRMLSVYWIAFHFFFFAAAFLTAGAVFGFGLLFGVVFALGVALLLTALTSEFLGTGPLFWASRNLGSLLYFKPKKALTSSCLEWLFLVFSVSNSLSISCLGLVQNLIGTELSLPLFKNYTNLDIYKP